MHTSRITTISLSLTHTHTHSLMAAGLRGSRDLLFMNHVKM